MPLVQVDDRCVFRFKWALKEQWFGIERNPAGGLAARVEDSHKRQLFDESELLLLFGSENFKRRVLHFSRLLDSGGATEHAIARLVGHEADAQQLAIQAKIWEVASTTQRGPKAGERRSKVTHLCSEAKMMNNVDAAMQAVHARGEHSGVLSLVARAGEIVHLDAQGELGQDSIVRLASLTKPVVAVGLMALCEAGELDLDAPLSVWFPEFAELKVLAPDTQSLQPARRTPTLRQLITHTAGFGYGLFDDSPVEDLYRKASLLGRGGGVGRLQMPLQELPGAVAQLPLAFQPGERWRYSVAHDLAGCLIERVTGARLGEFLQARVFGPLGMVDTGFSVPAEKLGRFATMYGPAKDGELPVLDTPSSSPFLDEAATPSGGGGMVSTLMDYYRFLGMLAGGGALDGTRVLREETVAAMTGNQLVGAQFPMMFGAQRMEGWGYGLGIGVLVGRQANGMLPGTFGWVGITGTSGWVSPRDDTILITLSQSSWNWAAADALHRAVYQPESSAPL